jgi:hypothetical protein
MMSRGGVDNIHVRLREQLEERGYSLAEASRLMGEKNLQRLRDVVAGRQKVPSDLLASATKLGVDIFYVLTGEITQSPNKSVEKSDSVDVVAQIKQGIAEMQSTLNLAAKAMGVELSEAPSAVYDLEHMLSNQADVTLLKDAIMLMDDLEFIDSEAEYRPEDKARAVIAMLYSALKKGDRKIDPDIAAAVLRGSV